MDRLVTTALFILGVIAWSVRKYGIMALFTRKLAKHAAVGRAKRTWLGPVRDHRQRMYDAASLIKTLQRERFEASMTAMASVA